jgi:SAM-dependent methyltransferase
MILSSNLTCLAKLLVIGHIGLDNFAHLSYILFAMIKTIRRWLKHIPGKGNWRTRIYSKIKAHPRLHLRYLGLSKALASRGIKPLLTLPPHLHEDRWKKQGTEGSDVLPETYLEHNDSIDKLFQDILPLLSPRSSILEIGCNAGRSLNYLFRKGYRNLTGIEIGAQALETFKKAFPEVYGSTSIIQGNVVEEIRKLESKSFDLVFTHSVLVNIEAKHNHIFREMCRICRGYILTLESEGSARVFPRHFQKMFEKHGFAMVSYRWLVWNNNKKLTFPNPVTGVDILKNNTIRLFAPVDVDQR